MSSKPKFYSLNTDKLKNDLDIKVDGDNKNIMQKEGRPFYIEISVSKTFSAFIPIRSKLPHKNGFITGQKKYNRSGLDYSKAYLVEKEYAEKYYDEVKIISRLEYNRVKRNQDLISNEFRKFLIKINERIINYDSLGFIQKRDVDFSSLQYQKERLRQCVEEINLSRKKH